MLQLFVIFLVIINYSLIESVSIDYPSNKHIEERLRKDLKSIEPIFRYYIVPREIQFQADATQNDLPYFLRCKGSKRSVQFTVPTSASKHLSLDTDYQTNTITAKLRRNQLTADLVGRYTCSESANDKLDETTVHVFIQDGRSVFTKRTYPKVFKQSGIHFFNLPCQTTSWYPQLSCPSSRQCKIRTCTPQERQANELKCNTPVCNQQEICIPVYYTPTDLKAEKVFFDPQIGFALENPIISNGLTHFTCMSNYTPSQESKIPYDSSDPEYVQIHQPSLTVLSDETVRLSCEIQYGTKVDRKTPILFWFEDIHNLQLISNQTDKPVFNLQTQVYSRNSTIALRGFKPNKVYRFYCVRISDQGLYSRSVDITCAAAPSLDLEVNLSGLDTDANTKIEYGSNAIYDISIFTIPRSSIILDLLRDGQSLLNDKRFELTPINNQENQYLEYTLTIYNIGFEDERDLKLTAKSSVSDKTIVIKPNIQGDPIGEISFIPEQIPHSIPWRNENSKNQLNIYSYGIYPNESYRIVCTVRHRSDLKQSLNIFLQYSQCTIDNCLTNLYDKTCRISSNDQTISSTSNRINKFQTQFVSSNSYKLDNPTKGYQYMCCYKQNDIVTLAKAVTILSHHRDMFNIHKPEFGLVTGDSLTYRCEGHQLIYNDLQMIYHDGLFTYERNRFDNQWRLRGSRQVKQIDIDWDSSTSQSVRSLIIKVKTPPLRMIGNNGYFQCIGVSKRSDIVPNANDTYTINVDDRVPLVFLTNLPTVSRLDRKTGANVDFDCKFNGRPKPKLIWYKGKLPLNNTDSTIQYGNDNSTIHITRAQALDTGYYTCELNNGHDAPLRRSFDLRVKGTNPHSRLGRIITLLIFVSVLLLILMFILLIIFAIKYYRMKKNVKSSVYHENQGVGIEDKSQPAFSQLTRIPLPDNFASQAQIRTFLGYVNGDSAPATKDDFKELGRGQFGVVYQVRLPDIGLVAGKILPETIRKTQKHRDKRKKSIDTEENENMITKQELQMKKAAEMLIDEIKVMYKAGKHVNIVGLKKVAYPETRFKFLFTGGPIHDEDSFYLMELCSNGSLESMLKSFDKPSSNPSNQKLSLYQTLVRQPDLNMTKAQAYDQCILTDDDLKLIAYQVACGVDYLNRRQIIHCDIAARNVLVTSRFIMKICDFGLATWTTYKNYREQLAQNESVQLEKTTTEIATHNLTPELARAFLRASTPDERLLLNRSSIKSDVWSFGIFLWTLFLKCRVRPFNRLLEEMERRSDGESFFHRLARVISDGQVLRYIDYQPEIPRNLYAIIRVCLVDENDRPEMTRVRAYLCHSNMLSKQAFDFYRLEYNRYQEENATDGNVERFPEDQGVRDLPAFDGENSIGNPSTTSNPHVTFRPPANEDTDYSQQEDDSYLPSRNQNITESNPPKVDIKNATPVKRRPPPPPPPRTHGGGSDDAYL